MNVSRVLRMNILLNYVRIWLAIQKIIITRHTNYGNCQRIINSIRQKVNVCEKYDFSYFCTLRNYPVEGIFFFIIFSTERVYHKEKNFCIKLIPSKNNWNFSMKLASNVKRIFYFWEPLKFNFILIVPSFLCCFVRIYTGI